MASKTPKARFVTLGKSKWVHVVHTELYDRKHSQCQTVRKYTVSGKVPGGGMSREAASALEPCPKCKTDEVLASLVTPEEKREQAKAKRDDLMDRIREENRPKTGKGSKKKAAKSKADKPVKEKVAKAPKVKKTSAGGTQEKADALVAFAEEHGWKAKAVESKPGIAVEATRGGETIVCYFVDGKYDTSRPAMLTAGSWSGKLRGVHGCRKQMANEGRDRPHPEPGKGRSGPRKKAAQEEDEIPEDESPEDALRRVPFLIDDNDVTIIAALAGKTIRWRNGVSGRVEEATLPVKADGKKRSLIQITEHPKSKERILDFLSVVGMGEHGEVYGPERAVKLTKIIRVVG